MDSATFFEQLAGKWFSQRTTHYLPQSSSQTGQSTLEIEYLTGDTPDLVQLCQQHQLDPAQALCGLKVNQDSQIDGNPQRQQQTTLMVMMTSDQPNQGQLLQQTGTAQPTSQGRYHLTDERLTLITETNEIQAEEQLWFLNPNLRMRTCVVKAANGFSLTAFCSEIRMGVTRPSS